MATQRGDAAPAADSELAGLDEVLELLDRH
jgi:hypothetical protein